MPPSPQARLGDMSMGHWVFAFKPMYFPPVPLVTASPDTMSCCIPACRVTDAAMPHFAFIYGFVPVPWIIHTPIAVSGSSECFINHLPAFRVGDSYGCGDIQAVGCPQNIVDG